MSPRNSDSPSTPGIFDALLLVAVVAMIVGITCIFMEFSQYGGAFGAKV